MSLKTEAERAAWKRIEERGAKDRFTTIHPGLVVGPALDRDFGASIELVRMMMTGAYPAMPPAAYPIVDVRDVADLHVAALKKPQTGGRRLMAVGGVMGMAEMSAKFADMGGKLYVEAGAAGSAAASTASPMAPGTDGGDSAAVKRSNEALGASDEATV
ncbi:MAG: hypothetical protein HC774_04320 [Sphingomonadales bacterium]|nr:hypothetical protein [Sphingomonadales bacterium]